MDVIEYQPIDLEILRIDTILGIDLYIKAPQEYVLYRSRKIPFNEKVRQNLLTHGVEYLYIPSTESSKFTNYIESNLGSIISDPGVKIETKRRILYESSLRIARDLIQQPTSIESIKRSSKVVENMVDLHLKDEGGFKKLVELMPQDYNIVSHCANVATYSVAIGKSLGIFNRNELYELGLGAFLHDIGKSKIPKDILNKPGSLNDEEFAKVKEHVILGYNMAIRIPIIPKQSILPILLHHERLTGNGYPSGREKNEISILGLITAVADSFDAMTTNRVYQNAKSTYKVLKELLNDNGNYDQRVVLEMTKLLGPDLETRDMQFNKEIITAI